MIATPSSIRSNAEYSLSSGIVNGGQGQQQPMAAGGGRLATSVAVKDNAGAAHQTLQMLKSALMRRGVRGICGLSRSFRVMDANKDKKIDPSEFLVGMQRAGLDLTVKEARALFSFIDKNNSG